MNIPDSLQTHINSLVIKHRGDGDGDDDKKDIILSINEWKDNQYFLDNSHIGYRLVPELVYVYFDFFRSGAFYNDLSTENKYNTIKNGFKEHLELETSGITDNVARELSTMFSRNTMDISIPGQSQTFVKQNINNVIKNYSTGLDTGTKNQATIKIIESSNLNISRIINYIIFLNHSPDKHKMNIYPDSLKFNMYAFPLVYNADQGIVDFSRSESMVSLFGCQFVGFNDWDFNLSGTSSNIVLKDVLVNFEKIYVTNTKKPARTGNE